MKLFNWKYKLFKNQVEFIRNKIAFLEFKLFQAREMREERRKLRDAEVNAIDAIDMQLPKDLKQEVKDQLMKERTAHLESKEKYEGDMKALDGEINGIAPDASNPQGYPGLLNQIETQRELMDMHKEYMKRHC